MHVNCENFSQLLYTSLRQVYYIGALFTIYINTMERSSKSKYSPEQCESSISTIFATIAQSGFLILFDLLTVLVIPALFTAIRYKPLSRTLFA